MDRRQLLIAGVIAPLAVLVVVLAFVLGRGSDAPEPARVTVRDERPPGAATRAVPADVPDDAPPARPPAEAIAPSSESADGEGLEAPPRREPRPARAQNVEAFAEDYLRRQGDPDPNELVNLYGDIVRYYAMGRVDLQTVYDDKLAYFQRFPDRRYGLASAVRVTPGANGALTLRFDYDYRTGGGPGGQRSGQAWAELDVVPSGATYTITGEHGSVY